jgi:hypothetical protein
MYFNFPMLIALSAAATGTLRAQGDVCSGIPDTARIEAIGAYSDMRFTEEHAYGNIVELWRADGCVFGLFEASEGPAGDTPTGELADVAYTPGTGRLSFTAKLTMGVTPAAGSKTMVPSRDLFAFTGHLGREAIRGNLKQSNQTRPDLAPVEHAVNLPRWKQGDQLMIEARTYGEWRKEVEPILQFRGPKW